ncbi:siphovirus Gp157 family protein [Hymenobacter sp. BT186]|uniref:Siphovirus Gp157 family protein n=1 Tax=Hymenobacter telluris TaxID=2816474 RepID=A0A939EW50_9BACT|nr:siphovirus Gp157 family protein [Hymenobacter telluris]MBO0358605.1 siphovirus Gp157 family protein [Hymenobacter telluris]MBW3374631.1 siphovirus Gp157 family protein [Hymenobacter norwichensis]
MKYAELLARVRLQNDKLDEQYGEIMAEDEVEIDNIENSLEWWTNYLIERAAEDKANAKAAKELAQRYADRAKVFERKEEYRKLGIFTLVAMAGKGIKTVAGNARIQEGVLSLTVNCPAELLPEEYRKVEYKADKDAIKRDLQAGKELNYAVLERGRPFLVIR